MLAFVSLPFFFESVLHRSQVETGLLMTPWPLAVGIGALIAGRLADKVSAAVLGAAGLVVLCAGLALLARLPENPTAAEIAWRMALCGLGFGFFQAPNNRSMLSAAHSREAGRPAVCSPPRDSRGKPSVLFSPPSRSGLRATPRP